MTLENNNKETIKNDDLTNQNKLKQQKKELIQIIQLLNNELESLKDEI